MTERKIETSPRQALFIPSQREEATLGESKAITDSYVTKDASDIVELFHPNRIPGLPYSLAEATVHAGKRTIPHVHTRSTEIYYFLSGRGTLVLGKECHVVSPGAAALIPPGTHHWVEAKETLRFLCVCCPPYDHAQTLLDEN
jgi:mannose-6-phosphate isomerase-like protein (cupin superfamily)